MSLMLKHLNLIKNKGVGVLEDLLVGIANSSFSICISVYLLIRMEGKLEKLSESILKLDKTIITSKR